jgi:hypothetical protein
LRWRLFDFGKVAAEVEKARGADAEALAVYRTPSYELPKMSRTLCLGSLKLRLT